MQLYPNASHGLHLVHMPCDPPPFRIRKKSRKPKGRTENSTHPKGRRDKGKRRRTE